MKVFRDCFGNAVRLTDERLDHVFENVEMAELGDEFEHVLQAPSEVRRSRSDENVRLFYRFYAATAVGGKWLCVVVGRGRVCYNRVSDRFCEGGRNPMAEKLRIWFDPEGDFLEVRFSDAPGCMRETANDALMERVDESGRIVGFSILGISRFRNEKPLEVELPVGK